MRTRPTALALTSAVILTLLADVEVAHAQEIALRGGLSSAALSFDRDHGSSEVDRRSGWLAGASMLLFPADRGGWQLDLLLVQKGAKNILRRDDEIRLLYFDMPLVLHMDYWQRGDRAAFLTVGPSVTFNLDAAGVADGVTEDIGNDIQHFDFGLNLGTGVEIGVLVVEARYTWGLRRVFAVDEVGFRNQTLALTAGIRFR